MAHFFRRKYPQIPILSTQSFHDTIRIDWDMSINMYIYIPWSSSIHHLHNIIHTSFNNNADQKNMKSLYMNIIS